MATAKPPTQIFLIVEGTSKIIGSRLTKDDAIEFAEFTFNQPSPENQFNRTFSIYRAVAHVKLEPKIVKNIKRTQEPDDEPAGA